MTYLVAFWTTLSIIIAINAMASPAKIPLPILVLAKASTTINPIPPAPIKAAICPLTKKDGLPEKAREIMDILKPKFKVIFDQQGSIGKRYYRQDEAGTPFGITIDHQTLEDNTVTVRFRDTQKQDRMLTENLVDILNEST